MYISIEDGADNQLTGEYEGLDPENRYTLVDTADTSSSSSSSSSRVQPLTIETAGNDTVEVISAPDCCSSAAHKAGLQARQRHVTSAAQMHDSAAVATATAATADTAAAAAAVAPTLGLCVADQKQKQAEYSKAHAIKKKKEHEEQAQLISELTTFKQEAALRIEELELKLAKRENAALMPGPGEPQTAGGGGAASLVVEPSGSSAQDPPTAAAIATASQFLGRMPGNTVAIRFHQAVAVLVVAAAADGHR